MACVLTAAGPEPRTFGTRTADWLTRSAWLQACGCTEVAMASTGDYWKPVCNMLAGAFAVLLVNAPPVKAVPGRKTDGKDAAWRAARLPHGWLRASFMPPVAQRARRDLPRHRRTGIRERVTLGHRVQQLLEDAHSKLASVASDMMGVSGRAIWAAWLAGHDAPHALAALATGRLRTKRDELAPALEGRITPQQRVVLTER